MNVQQVWRQTGTISVSSQAWGEAQGTKGSCQHCHLHHQGGKASASNHLPPVPLWLPLGEGGSRRCRRKRQQPRVLLRALKDRGDSLGSVMLTGKHEDLSSIPEAILK